MAALVKLTQVAEAMDITGNSVINYLNTTTGELVRFAHEEVEAVQADESYRLANLNNEVEKIRAILDDNTWVQLQTPGTKDQYNMMADFTATLNDDVAKDRLMECLDGKGAFGKFRNQVRRLQVEDRWIHFRTEEFKAFARAWMNENGIVYEE